MKDFILNTSLANGQIAIFYLGQESILVKSEDTYLLFDGYLSDFVDKNCCSENVKWVRRYAPPISGEELDFVDYVFCSHSHYDHADPWTIGAIAKVNKKAKYIIPAPFADKVVSYWVRKEDITEAYADKNIELEGISITPVPAAHEELAPDENGNFACLGFVVKLGDITLFHAGDCCVYEGLSERVQGTDIMMLPVNGRSYFQRYVRDIIGNMTSEEAIILAKKTNAEMIIPMHYDLYDVNCINPAHFVDCLYNMNPTQKFHMFVPGERFIFTK